MLNMSVLKNARPSLGVVGAVVGAVVAGLAAVAALVLWTHFGTTVFFEMVASGIASCF